VVTAKAGLRLSLVEQTLGTDTSRIVGHVQWSDGARVSRGHVDVYEADSRIKVASAPIEVLGRYRLRGLAAGTYVLRANTSVDPITPDLPAGIQWQQLLPQRTHRFLPDAATFATATVCRCRPPATPTWV
jgi:hypothetical protein